MICRTFGQVESAIDDIVKYRWENIWYKWYILNVYKKVCHFYHVIHILYLKSYVSTLEILVRTTGIKCHLSYSHSLWFMVILYSYKSLLFCDWPYMENKRISKLMTKKISLKMYIILYIRVEPTVQIWDFIV